MTSENPNFWNGKHELAAQADEFCVLVPGSGNCATLQGELFRASGRISYDWYNNGWGCNNWSGAVQFIAARFFDLPVQPSREIQDKLIKTLKAVSEYSHGEPTVCMDEDAAWVNITIIHEIVVQALIDNPTLIPNTEDMFDYQEPAYVPEPEDDEEDDDFEDQDED